MRGPDCTILETAGYFLLNWLSFFAYQNFQPTYFVIENLEAVMFPFSVVRAAVKTRPCKQLMTRCQKPSLRLHSTSQKPKSSPPQPGTFVVWGIGAVIAAGGGVYWLRSKQASDKTSDVPIIKPVGSEVEIPVTSPVKILDLRSANAKLREQAQSFMFDSTDGEKGRLDTVRIASNDPVEDEWSIGVGGGIQGEKTLYAGIFDGHA